MKRLRLISIVCMLFSFAACEKELPVSVEFNESRYQVNVGDEMDMLKELVVMNSEAAPVFTSSAAEVAEITSEGLLKALAAGETTVVAVVEGKEASCTVTVSEILAEKIEITAPESLAADETWAGVSVVVEPAGYNVENLVWTFTPSAEGLVFETEKVKATEYKVRFMSFVEDGKLTVKVADKNSDMAGTAVIAVTEKVVPAEKISLTLPEKGELTEGSWASVIASVTPEEYDAEHLIWEFEPSSPELGFQYEKVSAVEYRICFSSYVYGGDVTVVVTDELSEVFNQGRVKVLEKPLEGVVELKITPETLILNVGDEPVTLSVACTPSDYDKTLLEWTSSDEEVALVKDGVVTVIGAGEAVITLKDTISGKEASCKVTVTEPVKDVVIRKIVLNNTNLEMRVGEDAVQLIATCYDEEDNVIENYSGLEWSAAPMVGDNNKEIIVVEVSAQGVVTAKNPGFTQITVTDRTNTNVKALCNVSVKAAEVKVESVELLPASKTIEKGDVFTLTAKVTPDNADDKTLTFTSSDTEVATVNEEGKVTGVAPGEAVITATAVNGIKAECKVTVADESWVYLSSEMVTMVVGDEVTITATVTPENAPDKTVTWSSSAPEVASVDGGKVKALAAGQTVITAEAASGRKAECKVTVEEKVIDFEITLSPDNTNLQTKGLMQDKSVRLYATYTRRDNGKEYAPAVTSWKSSDETIATVDSEGNVTAVIEHIEKSGLENGVKVTITHVADEKEKSMEITVVKALPEQVILTAVPEVNGEQYKMMHGETFTFKAKVLPEKASQDVWFAGGGFLKIVDNTWTASTLGYNTFTAYAADNTNAKVDFAVTVLPVEITEMTLSNTTVNLIPGEQASLAVNFVPSNASYKSIEWSSSDESVAVVNENGTISAVGAGTAVITAYQKENDITRTCEVVVTEPVTELKVGDYYYSDGTTSPDLKADKTVIGVVFSLNNPTQMGDVRLAADYPECTHGYVVSLVEYAGQDFGSVSTYNGHGYYAALGLDTDAIVNTENANGYGNTKAHMALNGDKPDYCTMFNAENGIVATHTASVPSPSSASSWYVPSYKEMQMMAGVREALNAAITSAGGTAIAEPVDDDSDHGDYYWTSTIYGSWYERGKSWDHSKYPFDISRNGWTDRTQAFGQFPVRIILAF